MFCGVETREMRAGTKGGGGMTSFYVFRNERTSTEVLRVGHPRNSMRPVLVATPGRDVVPCVGPAATMTRHGSPQGEGFLGLDNNREGPAGRGWGWGDAGGEGVEYSTVCALCVMSRRPHQSNIHSSKFSLVGRRAGAACWRTR
jgi:hypothetical protein